MPQASPELRARWQTDGNALEFLDKNFTEERGVIRPRALSYPPTDEEWSAIQYLIEEWDYGYEER